MDYTRVRPLLIFFPRLSVFIFHLLDTIGFFFQYHTCPGYAYFFTQPCKLYKLKMDTCFHGIDLFVHLKKIIGFLLSAG